MNSCQSKRVRLKEVFFRNLAGVPSRRIGKSSSVKNQSSEMRLTKSIIFKNFFPLIAVFLADQAVAQNSMYFKNVDLKGLTAKYNFLKPSLDVGAFSSNARITELTYRPSTEGKMAVSFDYKNAGFTVAASTPRTSEFRKKYGEGQATDFQFRYAYESYYIESYYQQYKGYYLENAARVSTDPLGSGKALPNNDDLKVEHYGVAVFKLLNPERFDPKWALEFTRKPKDDGGTWYFVGGLNKHSLNTPISLVPKSAIENYKELVDLRKASAITLSAGGGGAYAWVFRKNWVLSGIFGASLGAQNLITEYTDDKKNNMSTAIKAHAKVVSGYSGEQFLLGFAFQTDSTMLNDKNSELALRSTESSLFAGWRF